MMLYMVWQITSVRIASSLHPLTHKSTPNPTSTISLSGRPVRLEPMSNTTPQQGILAPTVPDPIWRRTWQRSEHVRPLRSRLALLLSLMLLVGLVSCGPTSSDNLPSLGPSASTIAPSLFKQGLSPRNDTLTSTANPLPLASVNGTGAASGTGTVPGGDSPHAVPVLASEPGHPIEGLVVPEWMAQKLNSPRVRVRLQALETWAQSAPPGAVDPFILAFEDQDERVRARAQQLLEQDWARKAGAGR